MVRLVDIGAPRAISLASLRLQVFDESYYGMQVLDPSQAAVRPLAPGLVAAIVEDIAHGAASRTLRWSDVRKLGRSDDEIFELARRQAAGIGDRVASEMIASAVQLLICNGFYLSAKLLDTFITQDLRHGVLVAPISWHHWCAHVITEVSVRPIVSMMHYLARQIAEEMTVTAAERLRTDVYWIRRGGREMEKIDVTIGNDGMPDATLCADLAKLLD